MGEGSAFRLQSYQKELQDAVIRTPGLAARNPLGRLADYLRKSQRPRLEGTEER